MKIDRQAVFNKYDGHCAYCGCEITLKNFQVDHKQPKSVNGTDDFDNLMPSCRSCNNYKSTLTVDVLRVFINEMYKKLSRFSIFKISERFGMFEWKDWDGKFYFEKTDSE